MTTLLTKEVCSASSRVRQYPDVVLSHTVLSHIVLSDTVLFHRETINLEIDQTYFVLMFLPALIQLKFKSCLSTVVFVLEMFASGYEKHN